MIRLLPIFCFTLTLVLDQGVESRIVGGVPAPITYFPFVVSLRVNGAHSCGAVLISGTKAVTVAHCGGGSIATYSLLAGTAERLVSPCESPCQQRSLTSFIRHASFINDFNIGFPNDIAVFYFANLPSTAYVGYATLAPTGGDQFVGATGTIVGWGRIIVDYPLPLNLQQATGTIMSNGACAVGWSEVQINIGQICWSSLTASACNADDGGPVLVNNIVVGVMSWASPACNPAVPTVATRISFFRAWIDAN
jgi:trypsin